jgi:hypothetical protein
MAKKSKIQPILIKGEKIILNGENDLLNSTRASEQFVYDALVELFKTVDITNGKISTNPKAEEFLSSLDYRIYSALKKSGYGNAVKAFTMNYDLVSENVQNLHLSLGNGTLYAKDINPIKRIEIARTVDNLTQAGMYSSFIAPIRQGLYRNVLYGATVGETEQLIRDYVVSKKDNDSKLLKYVGQVAADSLHQFDGAINQTAKDVLSLNATQYVGSLLTDSRGQCRKWVDMNIIKDADLQEEIDWAFKPDSYFGGKKVSGMIPGTTAATFCIYRGGYRCRHRAFAIRVSTQKK